MRGLALLAVVGLSLGQKQARIGPDGKPLLNRPDLAECMKSESEPSPSQRLMTIITNSCFRKVTHESW